MSTNTEFEPANLTAMLAYRGQGNPPSTHPVTAVSNCFPGLEGDFRAIWRHLFVGLTLHESLNLVVEVAAGGDAEAQNIQPEMFILRVDGHSVVTNVTGPPPPLVPIQTLSEDVALEWSNALAEVMAARFPGGQGEEATVPVDFQGDGTTVITVSLKIRNLLAGLALPETTVGPGELTQGLCSPWQADYRECGCYYWAASRPDFVNVEISQTGQVSGRNWLDKTRSRRTYRPDNPADTQLVTYEELYRQWEELLPFQIAGRDEE